MGFIQLAPGILQHTARLSGSRSRMYACAAGEGRNSAQSLLSCAENTRWLPSPVYLRGTVEPGFGRGSRKLGTPTANLSAAVLQEGELSQDGVYVGFARVPELEPVGTEDGTARGPARKMVANCGWNRTFGDVKKRMVEAYVLGDYGRDFYGLELRLCIIGFLRQEMRFEGLDALKKNILNDVEVAKTVLDYPEAKSFAYDRYLFDP